MTSGTPVTEEEFNRLLAGYSRSAFRLETLDAYALDYERADFESFLATGTVNPLEVDWWRPWLDQVAQLTREGRVMSRVRILAEPPSDYQRWLMAADPWHAEAGERISYLARSRAREAGLPLEHDWWLLDDAAVIVMRFTATGEIDGKTLINEPGEVARYQRWRDLAVRYATPAGASAAA